LLRFTDAITIPSIQSSNLTNNTVTSVVRLEGRMWVFNVRFWAGKTQSAEAGAGVSQADTEKDVMLQLEEARFSDMVGCWSGVKLLFTCKQSYNLNVIERAVGRAMREG
jgi:hypothetical protein